MTCKNCGNVCKDDLCSVCSDMKKDMDALFETSEECRRQVKESTKTTRKLKKVLLEALRCWSDKVNEYCDRSKN